MDQTSVDAVVLKTWLGSTSTPTSGGTYTGATNKTFTFAVAETGELGVDDLVVKWADEKGNSGTIEIDADDWTDTTDYEVFQGVTVRFGAGRMVKAESFTIDVFNPTLQQAQEKGLAQVEKRVHTGFVDLITPVHSGSAADFTYRYEGVEIKVGVPDGTTLEGLRDIINNDLDNPGVTASIINDGQGTSTSYHLVLTGNETGAEHRIEFITSANPLSNFTVDEDSFDLAQRATDSMIKLDGYPSDSSKYIQRSTNTVSDVLDGIILELQNVGTSTVTTNNDISGMQDKIEQLVQSVNFVLSYIREETAYDAETGEKGTMLGNYTFDIVRSMINGILFGSIPGLDPETDTYTHLSQIGIKTDPDLGGQWVVDTNALSEALNNDIEGVARLFVRDPDHPVIISDGIAYSLSVKLAELTDDTSGITNVLINNYNGIISDIDTKIAREERRITLVRDRLEEKFARLETMLGQLEGQSDYLESQLKNLPSISS